MNIIHEKLFETDKVIKHYEEKDGVPIKYVCTTDLTRSDSPVDVFFRETPHPEFGNRYFGLFWNPVTSDLMITNADIIEELDFGMVKDGNGNFHYSKSHHDFKYIPGKENLFDIGESVYIDGGRQYVRVGGMPLPEIHYFVVKDGEFVETDTVPS